MPQSEEIARLRELCGELVQRGEADPKLVKRLTDGVEKVLADASRGPSRRRPHRRAAPVLDPFELSQHRPGMLEAGLRELDLEQLRDIVAYYGMDPRKLAMKWKTPDRVIAHIVQTVDARSRKGEVFRSNPARPPQRA